MEAAVCRRMSFGQALNLNLSLARTEILDYIESLYNRQRTHSSLNHLSPAALEF